MQTKQQKQTLVKELVERLAKTKAAVFADYTGLSVAKLTELRRKLSAQSGELKVAKKTLIDLSFKQGGIAGVNTKNMSGQVMVAFGYNDEVAPAKILNDFTKKNEQLKILGGILENKFIDSAGVLSLAKLPSKQELLGQLVGTIAAPMSEMLNVLQGNLRGLVRILSQINR
ncbi:MAG: 50S ribosomal protein L10 [Parcubacteria group bacterium GW2011_GWA2_43_9b]|uniref:Large ribosomal subunit protein uL10 n=1 Tax=Candidatus Portnoybacteria bacterium RIFCSPLOWO2_02_FULL_39_11 TaxID=1802001 RepID=A0A1G2FTQ2_9BACT|nr:MAG: 50S ribosomal protein L10 [Parcubacteria group bacterium GW2011_GWA2_43_9b]OGZ41465.1 MAG: 50S ribosomal protein L10 [Candidatus Portnoybacteria bacterium RIFCSPLOWO2_02_FULL_39_11]